MQTAHTATHTICVVCVKDDSKYDCSHVICSHLVTVLYDTATIHHEGFLKCDIRCSVIVGNKNKKRAYFVLISFALYIICSYL